MLKTFKPSPQIGQGGVKALLGLVTLFSSMHSFRYSSYVSVCTFVSCVSIFTVCDSLLPCDFTKQLSTIPSNCGTSVCSWFGLVWFSSVWPLCVCYLPSVYYHKILQNQFQNCGIFQCEFSIRGWFQSFYHIEYTWMKQDLELQQQ